VVSWVGGDHNFGSQILPDKGTIICNINKVKTGIKSSLYWFLRGGLIINVQKNITNEIIYDVF